MPAHLKLCQSLGVKRLPQEGLRILNIALVDEDGDGEMARVDG